MAKNYITIEKSKRSWNGNVKLLHLIDISDFWLTWLRPKKALKIQRKKGEWRKGGGFLALTAHWGAGFNTLLDLNKTNHKPFFVFSNQKMSIENQSYSEKYYRKLRVNYFHKISGSVAISTEGGGAYNLIKDKLLANGVPLILYDAPKTKLDSSNFLKILGHRYYISSGFINLITKGNIEYQLFSYELNFNTGFKEVTINKPNKTSSSKVLIDELSLFLENLIINSPEQWYFWNHSKYFLLKVENSI